MGLDMSYQAVPADREWWESILADAECREDLSMLPLLYRALQQGRDWRNPRQSDPFTGSRIGHVAAELIVVHPGIERRNLSIDRRWDQLHYLLSELRRQEAAWQNDAEESLDLGSIAIRGQKRLHPEVKATQGIPLRYTDAEAVREVVAFLESIRESDLRTHYVPFRMSEASVYKVSPSDGEDEFAYLRNDLQNLRRFYAQVKERGESVLVCLD